MAITGPPVETTWDLVARVADSPMFHRSARLRDLLLYICQRTLQGRFEELREQRIGIDVFARGPDFRPNEDNIVRVEARQLRKRLEEYFTSEGKDEPVIITIPKGAYIAVFERRALPPAPADAPEATIPAPVVEAEAAVTIQPAPSQTRAARFSWAIFFAATTALLLVIATWALLRDRELSSVPTPIHIAAADPLWKELFDREHQTYIVCADSALVLLQEVTNRSISLAEYVNRNYTSRAQKLSPEVQTLSKILPQRQYTNISDVRIVQAVLQLNDQYHGRSVIRSARNVELIDFKNGNFVLLGSRMSTPWVELFEPLLNFQFVSDPKLHRTGFRNRNPGPGEPGVYWTEGSSSQLDVTYGVIAFVPNLSHNGNVLMIAGATGEGTEAAGEYVSHPELLERILKTIHAIDKDHVRYFEVLLKSGTIAGIPKGGEIVSSRLIPVSK